MSDAAESFFGREDRGDTMDPAAFERFKERMAAASAQLQALAAQQQKQKKKEDELVKILLKFIQTGQKRDIMLLILRLLEQNVPAAFIVSLLLISNSEMQEALGVKLLAAPIQDEQNFRSTNHKNGSKETETLPDHYFHGAVLPLKIKIAIDIWTQEIIQRSEEYAHRILQTVLDADGLIKLPVVQLGIFSLRDYIQQENIKLDYDILKNFVSLMLENIIKKVKEDFETRKRLQ